MREARILLAHCLGVSADRMTLIAQDSVDDDVLEHAFAQASRRLFGEPISHIVGYRAFYGRRFIVDKRVLDPRPETEELIALALHEPFHEVLDLGTGSGAIITTLLAERPTAVGIGTDISAEALDVAKDNATRHGVIDRVGFVESSWFQAVGGTHDLIVSNPPYVTLAEMDDIQQGVRRYEPRIALTDEADGLTHYRHIIAHHDPYLNAGGRLMVEIGPTQAAAVTAMMQAAKLTEISVIPDLDGRDRVVWGRKPRKTA